MLAISKVILGKEPVESTAQRQKVGERASFAGIGFNTVLCGPKLDALRDVWREIILLDGDLLPGEAEAIRERCPRATVRAMKPNPRFAAQLRAIAMADEPLRDLYRRLRQGGSTAVSALAADCGLRSEQVLAGLTAFMQVGLAEVSLEPYAVRLLPPVKCSMADSPLIRYLRSLNESKGRRREDA